MIKTACFALIGALMSLPIAASLSMTANSAHAQNPILSAGKTAPANFDAAKIEQLQNTPLIAPHNNPRRPNHPWILVGIRSQTLTYFDENGSALRRFSISSAKNGLGEIENSYQTPRGWHQVCDKVGDGVEADTILFRQAVTPWKYTPALHAEFPNKDWILTRILWLCGLEFGHNLGLNRFGQNVDSYQRLIYIHGAGSHVPWGTPSSRGCIRMRSDDVIDLYNLSLIGTDVLIDENA